VEDGIRDGGIGSLIADAVHAVSSSVVVESLGVPTKFIPHNNPDVILASMGLVADGIASAVQRLLA
jgi:1-deoxy-D-xylulose-5-phosphate synthase